MAVGALWLYLGVASKGLFFPWFPLSSCNSKSCLLVKYCVIVYNNIYNYQMDVIMIYKITPHL